MNIKGKLLCDHNKNRGKDLQYTSAYKTVLQRLSMFLKFRTGGVKGMYQFVFIWIMEVLNENDKIGSL